MSESLKFPESKQTQSFSSLQPSSHSITEEKEHSNSVLNELILTSQPPNATIDSTFKAKISLKSKVATNNVGTTSTRVPSTKGGKKKSAPMTRIQVVSALPARKEELTPNHVALDKDDDFDTTPFTSAENKNKSGTRSPKQIGLKTSKRREKKTSTLETETNTPKLKKKTESSQAVFPTVLSTASETQALVPSRLSVRKSRTRSVSRARSISRHSRACSPSFSPSNSSSFSSGRGLSSLSTPSSISSVSFVASNSNICHFTPDSNQIQNRQKGYVQAQSHHHPVGDVDSIKLPRPYPVSAFEFSPVASSVVNMSDGVNQKRGILNSIGSTWNNQNQQASRNDSPRDYDIGFPSKSSSTRNENCTRNDFKDTTSIDCGPVLQVYNDVIISAPFSPHDSALYSISDFKANQQIAESNSSRNRSAFTTSRDLILGATRFMKEQQQNLGNGRNSSKNTTRKNDKTEVYKDGENQKYIANNATIPKSGTDTDNRMLANEKDISLFDSAKSSKIASPKRKKTKKQTTSHLDTLFISPGDIMEANFLLCSIVEKMIQNGHLGDTSILYSCTKKCHTSPFFVADFIVLTALDEDLRRKGPNISSTSSSTCVCKVARSLSNSIIAGFVDTFCEFSSSQIALVELGLIIRNVSLVQARKALVLKEEREKAKIIGASQLPDSEDERWQFPQTQQATSSLEPDEYDDKSESWEDWGMDLSDVEKGDFHQETQQVTQLEQKEPRSLMPMIFKNQSTTTRQHVFDFTSPTSSSSNSLSSDVTKKELLNSICSDSNSHPVPHTFPRDIGTFVVEMDSFGQIVRCNIESTIMDPSLIDSTVCSLPGRLISPPLQETNEHTSEIDLISPLASASRVPRNSFNAVETWSSETSPTLPLVSTLTQAHSKASLTDENGKENRNVNERGDGDGDKDGNIDKNGNVDKDIDIENVKDGNMTANYTQTMRETYIGFPPMKPFSTFSTTSSNTGLAMDLVVDPSAFSQTLRREDGTFVVSFDGFSHLAGNHNYENGTALTESSFYAATTETTALSTTLSSHTQSSSITSISNETYQDSRSPPSCKQYQTQNNQDVCSSELQTLSNTMSIGSSRINENNPIQPKLLHQSPPVTRSSFGSMQGKKKSKKRRERSSFPARLSFLWGAQPFTPSPVTSLPTYSSSSTLEGEKNCKSTSANDLCEDMDNINMVKKQPQSVHSFEPTEYISSTYDELDTFGIIKTHTRSHESSLSKNKDIKKESQLQSIPTLPCVDVDVDVMKTAQMTEELSFKKPCAISDDLVPHLSALSLEHNEEAHSNSSSIIPSPSSFGCAVHHPVCTTAGGESDSGVFSDTTISLSAISNAAPFFSDIHRDFPLPSRIRTSNSSFSSNSTSTSTSVSQNSGHLSRLKSKAQMKPRISRRSLTIAESSSSLSTSSRVFRIPITEDMLNIARSRVRLAVSSADNMESNVDDEIKQTTAKETMETIGNIMSPTCSYSLSSITPEGEILRTIANVEGSINSSKLRPIFNTPENELLPVETNQSLAISGIYYHQPILQPTPRIPLSPSILYAKSRVVKTLEDTEHLQSISKSPPLPVLDVDVALRRELLKLLKEAHTASTQCFSTFSSQTSSKILQEARRVAIPHRNSTVILSPRAMYVKNQRNRMKINNELTTIALAQHVLDEESENNLVQRSRQAQMQEFAHLHTRLKSELETKWQQRSQRSHYRHRSQSSVRRLSFQFYNPKIGQVDHEEYEQCNESEIESSVTSEISRSDSFDHEENGNDYPQHHRAGDDGEEESDVDSNSDIMVQKMALHFPQKHTEEKETYAQRLDDTFQRSQQGFNDFDENDISISPALPHLPLPRPVQDVFTQENGDFENGFSDTSDFYSSIEFHEEKKIRQKSTLAQTGSICWAKNQLRSESGLEKDSNLPLSPFVGNERGLISPSNIATWRTIGKHNAAVIGHQSLGTSKSCSKLLSPMTSFGLSKPMTPQAPENSIKDQSKEKTSSLLKSRHETVSQIEYNNSRVEIEDNLENKSNVTSRTRNKVKIDQTSTKYPLASPPSPGNSSPPTSESNNELNDENLFLSSMSISSVCSLSPQFSISCISPNSSTSSSSLTTPTSRTSMPPSPINLEPCVLSGDPRARWSDQKYSQDEIINLDANFLEIAGLSKSTNLQKSITDVENTSDAFSDSNIFDNFTNRNELFSFTSACGDAVVNEELLTTQIRAIRLSFGAPENVNIQSGELKTSEKTISNIQNVSLQEITQPQSLPQPHVRTQPPGRSTPILKNSRDKPSLVSTSGFTEDTVATEETSDNSETETEDLVKLEPKIQVVHDLSQSYISKKSTGSFVSRLSGHIVSWGSLLSKVPQIIKIIKARSVEGLSLPMFFMEIITQVTAVLYHRALNLPVNTYGENVSLGVGNFAISFLFLIFAKSKAIKMLSVATLFSPIILSILSHFSPASLKTLQAARLPIYIFSRLPQMLMLYRSKDPGQLNPTSFAINFLGSVARVLTSAKDGVNDPLILSGFWASIALNAAVLVQYYYYKTKLKRL